MILLSYPINIVITYATTLIVEFLWFYSFDNSLHRSTYLPEHEIPITNLIRPAGYHSFEWERLKLDTSTSVEFIIEFDPASREFAVVGLKLFLRKITILSSSETPLMINRKIILTSEDVVRARMPTALPWGAKWKWWARTTCRKQTWGR